MAGLSWEVLCRKGREHSVTLQYCEYLRCRNPRPVTLQIGGPKGAVMGRLGTAGEGVNKCAQKDAPLSDYPRLTGPLLVL